MCADYHPVPAFALERMYSLHLVLRSFQGIPFDATPSECSACDFPVVANLASATASIPPSFGF